MSKAERKNNKIIAVTIISLCILLVFVLFESRKTPLSDNEMKIEYKSDDKITFSAEVSRDEIFGKLKEKGVEIPPLFLVLPDRLELFCDAEIKVSEEDKKPSVSILALKLNGLEVPQKLLSEIGEINLDFKRSLVYN